MEGFEVKNEVGSLYFFASCIETLHLGTSIQDLNAQGYMWFRQQYEEMGTWHGQGLVPGMIRIVQVGSRGGSSFLFALWISRRNCRIGPQAENMKVHKHLDCLMGAGMAPLAILHL